MGVMLRVATTFPKIKGGDPPMGLVARESAYRLVRTPARYCDKRMGI